MVSPMQTLRFLYLSLPIGLSAGLSLHSRSTAYDGSTSTSPSDSASSGHVTFRPATRSAVNCRNTSSVRSVGNRRLCRARAFTSVHRLSTRTLRKVGLAASSPVGWGSAYRRCLSPVNSLWIEGFTAPTGSSIPGEVSTTRPEAVRCLICGSTEEGRRQDDRGIEKAAGFGCRVAEPASVLMATWASRSAPAQRIWPLIQLYPSSRIA